MKSDNALQLEIERQMREVWEWNDHDFDSAVAVALQVADQATEAATVRAAVAQEECSRRYWEKVLDHAVQAEKKRVLCKIKELKDACTVSGTRTAYQKLLRWLSDSKGGARE